MTSTNRLYKAVNSPLYRAVRSRPVIDVNTRYGGHLAGLHPDPEGTVITDDDIAQEAAQVAELEEQRRQGKRRRGK